MFSKEELKHILILLRRVDIKGEEAPNVAMLLNKVQRMLVVQPMGGPGAQVAKQPVDIKNNKAKK